MRGRRAAGSWAFAAACLVLVAGACGGSTAEVPSSPPSSAAAAATAPSPSTTTTTTPEVSPGEIWPVATAEEVGMSSDVLADLVLEAAAEGGFDSITLVRNGYVVLDAVMYPFPEQAAHNVHSITKSVTGTLVGIAIDRGLLAGVDVPVVELLPEAAPDDIGELKTAMTVENLLTMTSGLECRDSARYEWQGLIEMMESDDWAKHVLALPMSEEPGTRFEYCSGASELLSAILSEITGGPASVFADEVLFEPLGITDYEWPANPQGVTFGSGDLMLRPADMAKLGFLYLQDGEWDGQPIVSPSWVEAATTIHAGEPTSSDKYGYQWWINWAGHPMAAGFAGQFIVIIPEHDLVAVFTSGLDVDSWRAPLGLLYDHVLRSVRADHPLPPDPDAEARLSSAVAAAGSEPDAQIVELPAMAATVDAVRYEFRPNDWGWDWFQIHFDGPTARIAGENAEGSFDWLVGLDGRFRVDDEEPVAWRGAWQSENRFVIEYHVIGHSDRGTIQFVFDQGAVRAQEQLTTTLDIRSSWADAAP